MVSLRKLKPVRTSYALSGGRTLPLGVNYRYRETRFAQRTLALMTFFALSEGRTRENMRR
jgi:hypothetical protein|uniref:Uncharacterized protein n=1 Tax=Picea glauca TaxID=3330 RepID=A0A101LUX6_PICGL|nr:hypothetical protein ABT39_MTgene2176 [Picea glauca]